MQAANEQVLPDGWKFYIRAPGADDSPFARIGSWALWKAYSWVAPLSHENVFSKALLLLVLLSYIQAFNDGNKRTARIISNAILVCNNYCPISFRTVDSVEYKKAMLSFYEQNNITAFRRIFIEQFEFAVKTYF